MIQKGIKTSNTDESYFYASALALVGRADYRGQRCGVTYYINEDTAPLTLNEVEGGIVTMNNE